VKGVAAIAYSINETLFPKQSIVNQQAAIANFKPRLTTLVGYVESKHSLRE
jgi:hypothetical protein